MPNKPVFSPSGRQQQGSEFGGVIEESGVFPKDETALTSGDKLRLGYRTGQELDPSAPVTRRSWEGLAEPGDSVVDVDA